MPKKLFTTLLFFLYILNFPAFLAARTKIVTLVIDHGSGEAYIELGDKSQRDYQRLKNGEKHYFMIKSGEKMFIELRRPNPVLYEYKWKGIEKQKTQDYESALKLADILKEIIKPFEEKKLQEEISKIEYNLKNFRFTDSERKNKKERINYYTNLQKKISALEISKLINFIRDAILYAEQIPELKKVSMGSDNEVNAAKSKVRKWNVENLEKKILDCYKKIDEHQISFIKNPGKQMMDPIIPYGENSPDEIDLKLILFAKDQQSNILKTLESLKIFAEAFLKINEIIPLDEMEYSSSERAVGSIDVKASDSKAEKGKLGKYDVVVEPCTPVRFTFMPTIVYSFVKNDEGKAAGWITPLVFGIIPKPFDDPIFGGEFQLGVNPGKDKLGLFLGAGFRIYEKIFFGAGATYQQIGEDDYKFGWYLNVAYELK
ncbi:MAG: hypothetical protein JXB26_19065 [Candidatus Aminicenantes bacterium]|nr:hypothetical protein [Candidatus Aminicenantes bacterium]